MEADIKFIQSTDTPHKDCQRFLEYAAKDKPSIGINLAAMNNLFQHLLKDELGLKKFWRAIASVCLDREGRTGVVVFFTSSTTSTRSFRKSDTVPEFEPYIDRLHHFEVSPHGSLRFLDDEPPTIMNLPRHLQDRIWRMSFTYHEPQIISLETADFVLKSMAPLPLAKKLSPWLSHVYRDVNKFIIELKSSSETTDLCGIDKICSILYDIENDYELRCRCS